MYHNILNLSLKRCRWDVMFVSIVKTLALQSYEMKCVLTSWSRLSLSFCILQTILGVGCLCA